MMESYNALNGKLGFLKKGLFSKDEYGNILSLSDKEQLVDYLSTNPLYDNEMNDYKEHSQDFLGLQYNYYAERYGFEFLIHKSEVRIMQKLKPFIGVFHKDFIESLIFKYEIYDLKLILRSIVEKDPLDLEKEMLTYKTSRYLDHDRLANCDNIRQFTEALIGTPFRHAIYSVRDEDVLQKHFHIEMSLDNLYFLEIEKASKKLRPKDKKLVNEYFHTLIDLVNIQWILRSKRFYHLSNEEIFNYSIRHGKIFKGEKLKTLVYTQNVQEAVSYIRENGYYKSFQEKNNKDTVYQRMLENFYDKQTVLIDYQNDIGTFLKFYIRFDNQNRNLIKLAEMQKYSLKDKEEIKSFLVGV